MAAIPAESRESGAQAAPEKELVGVEAGKTLKFDQTRDEMAVFSRADPEIDLHEKWMGILVGDDQPRRNRVLRVGAECRSLHLSDQVARGRFDFPCEFRVRKIGVSEIRKSAGQISV